VKFWRFFDRWVPILLAVLAILGLASQGYKISYLLGTLTEIREERKEEEKDYQLLMTYIVNTREMLIRSGINPLPLPKLKEQRKEESKRR